MESAELVNRLNQVKQEDWQEIAKQALKDSEVPELRDLSDENLGFLVSQLKEQGQPLDGAKVAQAFFQLGKKMRED